MRLGDRRKTSRYDCTHPLKYAYAGAPPRMGLLNEISTGGVLLATHHPVPGRIPTSKCTVTSEGAQTISRTALHLWNSATMCSNS